MSSSASDPTIPAKSPSFQFYANDFTSGTVDLSTEDVGAYIRLLCYQWEKGAIPSDLTAQGRIAGLTTLRMRGTWSRIKRHFSEATAGGFVNRKLEKVRQGQIAFRRRQADNGKLGGRPKKPSDNPSLTQTETQTSELGNPDKSSSVFGLQSSNQKIAGDGMGTDERVKSIAYQLREIYPEVYAASRAGAVYRTTVKTADRDNPNYYAAAELHPNIDRLRALLEVFLTRPMGDKSSPGTPGQFVNMLPGCDEVLRRSGWKATA